MPCGTTTPKRGKSAEARGASPSRSPPPLPPPSTVHMRPALPSQHPPQVPPSPETP
eukprot:CAMPEP_0181203994 /NCGR_PEP_ID=MMETSP1096-20121128/19693_1 /TAXON_ID=156174 ORGANISM="Chrysochromulina ericina, Strain CCMP281" /NCGR_SAMPLE_ID=MMETSP1096 /ASSEMBLY_ACC=CAM_ASM_000453 /LENGTH=55 /DNA_ID=CAMNT_0023294653 /DNA_START=138 /DNA_END=302 /DNA_ORIENTATION=+